MNPAVGRFAPSPTGPLHLGSLLAALASFLEARAQGARWLVRIDDLDAQRVVPGAATGILDTLRAFGLYWDGPTIRQSERDSAYESAIAQLKRDGRAFDCGCTRREARHGPLGIEGPIYPGTCRDGLPAGRTPRSVRFRVSAEAIELDDTISGRFTQVLARDVGDFVIRRADGVAAYQLATVVDDAYQGVTEIVRGGDLLSSTPRQIALQHALGVTRPRYAHVPVLVDHRGEKLGKRTGALALSPYDRTRQVWQCLSWLGQAPPDAYRDGELGDLMRWATDNWSITAVPSTARITI